MQPVGGGHDLILIVPARIGHERINGSVTRIGTHLKIREAAFKRPAAVGSRYAQEIEPPFLSDIRLRHVRILAEEAKIGVHDEIGIEGIDASEGEAVRLALARAGIGAVDRRALQCLAENRFIDRKEIEHAVTPPNIELAVDVPVDLAVNCPAVEEKTG